MGVFSKPGAQVSPPDPAAAADLPDILALSSAEVQLPTLNMSSSELGDISLSGLINTIIAPEQADQVHNQIQNVVQVDPNTIQGQNQSITFHLQPMQQPQPDQKPFVRILEQPASHKLRFRY